MTTILVTGANGEIGHGLITHLAGQSGAKIVALDLHPLDSNLQVFCHHSLAANILDRAALADLFEQFQFDAIYHLAALLSTSAERKPEKAHDVNVNGTLYLLDLANQQARAQARDILFMYPSSIAAYGLPDLDTKARVGKVTEGEWLTPTTMYGINKLYGENLGSYYADHYAQLDEHPPAGRIDFRALRFPGLISAVTMPSGGTSDYIPEMLHHAAQGKPYPCFVREDTRIPFMAMPDGVRALLSLADAPRQSLTRRVYNVAAFNPSAEEFRVALAGILPGQTVTYEPHLKRQAIVDSWPADCDDSAARADWGWQPEYGFERALTEYLVPTVSGQYQIPT